MAISKEKGKFSLCVNKTWSVIKKKKKKCYIAKPCKGQNK